MDQKAFQDYYPDHLSHCYGCGRLNQNGLQIRSYWDGEESVAVFYPKPFHTAIPGYVYGGLIASMIDCHGTGTASAAAYRAEGRSMDTEPALRFLTGSLHVEYLRPTPLGVPLEVRGRVKEIKGRKVTVSATVSAKGEVCARGEVVAIQMPEHLEKELLSGDKGLNTESETYDALRDKSCVRSSCEFLDLEGGGLMRIKANGIQMNYELSGKQDAPVLVLSHSLASSLIMWDPQMDALKSHFQILRYDVRGHGGTEAPKGPYTLKLLVEDVVGLMDALNIRSIHWVGLSMGGMIGQGLALDHADRLKSLALCDTASFISEEAQPLWQERFDAVRGEGMQALVDATMERWFTPFFLRLNPPVVQKIRQEILKTPVEGYVGCGEAIRRLNYTDRLGEINLPTLIIVGEEDPGTPVSSAQDIHERIAESKLVILPSARHLSNVEQPEAFNAALLGFLRNL